MKVFPIRPLSGFRGEVFLLGDKSIAHRSIILSALCRAKTRILNFPANKDCLHTLEAFKKFGIKITQKRLRSRLKSLEVTVYGKGLYGLKGPDRPIFVGDSGTTLRLLLGVMAAQNFKAKLMAGKSLAHRPMLRVTGPLRMMAAEIRGQKKMENGRREEYPPITVKGASLAPIIYKLPVASAQVKSAILLAGLYVEGKTIVHDPFATRDHTERMLKLFKANIAVKKDSIAVRGNKELVSPGTLTIPGDISSAAFFMVLAAIVPNSRIVIRGVSLNPTRTGIIKVLRRMNADIRATEYGRRNTELEPVGDVIVKSSTLKGTVVKKGEIPSLIDELPVLMVAASLAKGKTVFENVGELRVKEADRIKSMLQDLRKMGAKVSVTGPEGSEKMIIQGVKRLKGARVRSFADHRTAMSMIVAGLAAEGATSIDDVSCINKSFPDFLHLINTLKA